MITRERVEKLTEILQASQDRKRQLLALEPTEALLEINKLGYDFTLDEINDYGNMLRLTIAQEDELDINTLDSIAGGTNIIQTESLMSKLGLESESGSGW